jgi:hypothetical protein
LIIQLYKYTRDVAPQVILSGRVTAAFDDEVALLKMAQLGNKKIAIATTTVTSFVHAEQTLKVRPFSCSLTPALSNWAPKSRLADITTAIPFCPKMLERTFDSPQLGHCCLMKPSHPLN